MANSEARKTGAERQAAFAVRQFEKGARLVKAWLSLSTVEALKDRYPGKRGGIDWEMVAEAALSQFEPTSERKIS